MLSSAFLMFLRKTLDKRHWIGYNVLSIYGPVAQLGERSVRIREVVGSNPFRSTITILAASVD